jgi:NFU1 iron-sulfur cluster scaffold homolog, mitochondrial
MAAASFTPRPTRGWSRTRSGVPGAVRELTGQAPGSILPIVDPEIRITAEPIDGSRCRFVVSVPLLEGARRFTSAEEAGGSPLAQALFAVSGVTEVVVSGGTVTVTKSGPAPWQVTGKEVGAAIRKVLAAGLPPVTAAPPPPSADDEVLYGRVAELFEAEINPAVARHGGFVELLDVQDGVVMLRMGGGCQGCGMADVTLRQGIETALRERVPEVAGIVDATDHSAGTNPYVTASKK